MGSMKPRSFRQIIPGLFPGMMLLITTACSKDKQDAPAQANNSLTGKNWTLYSHRTVRKDSNNVVLGDTTVFANCSGSSYVRLNMDSTAYAVRYCLNSNNNQMPGKWAMRNDSLVVVIPYWRCSFGTGGCVEVNMGIPMVKLVDVKPTEFTGYDKHSMYAQLQNGWYEIRYEDYYTYRSN
jgi:hypothetical protein